jgi:hypothetical protein
MRSCDRYLDRHLLEQADTPLSPEQFDRIVNAPCVGDEHEETVALIRWFERRFPTAKQRLDWASKSFEEWTRPVRVLGPANPDAGRSRPAE